MCFQAEFFQAFAHAKAGHAALHQQQAGALGASGWVGFGHHDHQVGVPAVGDKGLAAIEQVAAIALQQGGSFDALQVRTGCRLAHGNGAHHLATGQPGQVFLLLRLGAVMQQVGRHNLAVQAVANAAETCFRQFFHLYHRVQLVGASAAISLRHGHA